MTGCLNIIMEKYNSTSKDTVWTTIMEIASKHPKGCGWKRKTAKNKKQQKQFKDIYKLHNFMYHLPSIMYTLTELVYLSISKSNCQDCYTETLVESALKLTGYLAQIHQPLKYYIWNSDWHKIMYDDAQWTKTTCVKDFIQDCLKKTVLVCPDQCQQSRLCDLMHHYLHEILETLILMSVSCNYQPEVSHWYCTPYEIGTSGNNNLFRIVDDIIFRAQLPKFSDTTEGE